MEEDDVGAHVVSVYDGVGGRAEVGVVEAEDDVGVVDGPECHQFAVEVQYFGGAGLFVEVVDILGDDLHVEVVFEGSDAAVGVVGGDVGELGAAVVVELVDKGGVTSEAVGRANVHDVVLFPKAVGVAECCDAAFGADACAGRYYKFLFHDGGN